MPRLRIRYFLGDLVSTAAACSLIAAVTGSCVPADWPPWAAMPVGMALGMALAIPCLLATGPLLGLIEPMIQIMLGGMVAGMAAVMAAAQEPGPGLFSLTVLGAGCGAFTSLAVGASDWILRRGEPDE